MSVDPIQTERMAVLVIDDDPAALALMSAALENEPINLLTTTDPMQGLELFFRKRPRVVLLDLNMRGMSGMEVLDRIVQHDPGTDVILITADYSNESAVEAIQRGASDYLEKSTDLGRLRSKLSALLSEAQKRSIALRLDRELVDTYQFHGIVGRSPLMLEMFGTLRRVAPHFRTMLVQGETGTGKELVASVLQKLGSGRVDRFAVCNCSAIAETLVESELFGYVRGAFTGATQDKPGLFEYADGGTVFLDEIGEMPLASQSKLLRVLQNQQIQRLGSPAPRHVDVRVIAATNRDLRREVREGRFREDLFYRLSMVTIEVPPLRKRKEDIPLLQRFMIEKYSKLYAKQIRGITRRGQSLLARHNWPGNVRELENVIGNACMMTNSEVVDVGDFPPYLSNAAVSESKVDDELISLEEAQQRHIARVLERVNGKKGVAAEILQISRTTLYNALAKMEAAEKNKTSE